MADPFIPLYTVDAQGNTIRSTPDGSWEMVTPEAAPLAAPTGVPVNVRHTASGAALPAVPEAAPAVDSAGQSGSTGGYSGRGSYRSRPPSGGYDDEYQSRPEYASGALHPAWGGDPLVPGGFWGANDLTEGPARLPRGLGTVEDPRGSYGGSHPSGYGGESGFNGGGNAHPLYAKIAAKGNAMEAKVRGMASGAGMGSGGGGMAGAAGSGYGSAGTAKPDEPPMRGLAKDMDPAQAAGLSTHPTFLLPKLFPGLSGASPLYQSLAAMPTAQWATILGSGKKGPSKMVNTLGGIYEAAGTTGDLPEFDQVMGALSNPSKGLDRMFMGEKAGKGDQESFNAPGYIYGAEPLSATDAAYQYGPLLDSALALLPPDTAMKYSAQPGGYGAYLIDRWGSKALKRPAGKGKSITGFVGRKLMR